MGVKGGKSYLLIDHRAAPEGTLLEADVMICAHCNCSELPKKLGLLLPQDVQWARAERATCRKCMAYCHRACVSECTPRDEMVELAIKYPQGNWIGRDLQTGLPLFDQRLRDRHKIY